MNLTTTERYQTFVEAGLSAAVAEIDGLRKQMVDEAMSTRHTEIRRRNFSSRAAQTEDCADLIERIDPAEIVRNVMAVMSSGPDAFMTTAKPTEPGWYWLLASGYQLPTIVYVGYIEPDVTRVWSLSHAGAGRMLSDGFFNDALWSAAPITPPVKEQP